MNERTKSILWGGLIVGVLDGLDATIYFGLRGVPAERIFQYIASALLGRSAFEGGAATFFFGVFLHFVNATLISAVYHRASDLLPILVRRAVWCGMLYGVAVHFFMSHLVIPLTAAPQGKFSFPNMLNGVIGHALLVGLPIALLARRRR